MKHLTNAILKASLLLLIAGFMVFSGCQQQTDYSREIDPIVNKYVEVWNTGNVDELDAIIDSNFVRHAESTSAEGLDNLKKLITGTRTAFPDLHLTLSDKIYSEDRFAAHFSFTATNTGPGQMPPTGKSVKVWGLIIAHFKNGKEIEEWVGYDNQSLLEQLGFTLTPPAAPTKK